MASRPLIIFDVDGTLLDAVKADNTCFEAAFMEVTGRVLDPELWATFTEITGPAIVHQALGQDHPNRREVEARVLKSFLAKLQDGQRRDPGFVRAFPGARDLISGLKRSDDFDVAIATGCWRETAHFKLQKAGFDWMDVPFACASDRHRRADIILLAAERAGLSLDQAIYVGDGTWDLRATRELGIPFVGVGKNIEALRKAGANHIMEELNLSSLARALEEIDRTDLRPQVA